jgi:hypothetical protein
MHSQETPKQRIAAEVARRGRLEFVAGCSAILDGSDLCGDLILVLGGRHAEAVLAGSEGGPEGYWPRVWAARGFLHCYEPTANVALKAALLDEAWRVREMALKVIVRYAVAELLEDALELRADEVQRVRSAAERAVSLLMSNTDRSS